MENHAAPVQIYTVAGPKKSSLYFGFEVPGGEDFINISANLIAELNPSLNFRVCIGHLVDWGALTLAPVQTNLSFCIHEVSKGDLRLMLIDHPSAQHGALLDWVIAAHPPENSIFTIMDPDFFVVNKSIFNNLMEQLHAPIITAGVGYPSSISKYAYSDFPVVYFQIFNSNFEWIFSPEDAGVTLPGARTTRMSGIVSTCTRLLRGFIRVVEGKSLNLSSWRVWISQLARIPYELATGDPENFRDTGYKNRMRYGAGAAKTFENVTRTSISRFGIDVRAWLENNPELRNRLVPPAWYALRHGTLEKRNFKNQPWIYLLLSKLPFRGIRNGSATPLIDLTRLNLSEEQRRVVILLENLGADFYALDDELLGFHLGSKAKLHLLRHLDGLTGLKSLLRILVEAK
jgi:hypothetical protein